MLITDKRIKGFKLIRLLGRGGMGEVYLAIQEDLERPVALKLIYNNYNSEVAQRFKREARIAAALQHPNIVNIYGVGEEKDFFYIVMEYVEGRSIDQILQDGPLPEIEVWRDIALPICDALQTAYSKGFIHRDIKPANLMFDVNGRVKLTDFGLSRRHDDNMGLTRTGTVLGTPDYMSPEQSSGKELDCRSDIYSLGASIYQLLTGNKLFDGEDFVDTIVKHKTELILPPQHYQPHLKLETSFILGHMLAKEAEHRYQNYEELVIDIRALLHDLPLVFAREPKSLAVYKFSPAKKLKPMQKISNWFFRSASAPAKEESPSHPGKANLPGKSSISSRIMLAMAVQEQVTEALPKTEKVSLIVGEKNTIAPPSEPEPAPVMEKREAAQQNVFEEQQFKNFMISFYQEIRPLLVKLTSNTLIAAFRIPSYHMVVLEGEIENEKIQEIPLNVPGLLEIVTKISDQKNGSFMEGFTENLYFAFIWNYEKQVILLYLDLFADRSKTSWYHTNVAVLHKNIKER